MFRFSWIDSLLQYVISPFFCLGHKTKQKQVKKRPFLGRASFHPVFARGKIQTSRNKTMREKPAKLEQKSNSPFKYSIVKTSCWPSAQRILTSKHLLIAERRNDCHYTTQINIHSNMMPQTSCWALKKN